VQALDQSPQHRIVLIGASNLTRGISTVVESVQNIWGSPLDICCALGHGRSYGWTSNVLGRSLPGIVQCGLWKTLEERPKLPTAALVTDIGNDLMYGAPVSQIVRWVETVLNRLQRADAQVTMTLLPLGSAFRLSEWRFQMVRRILFPGRNMKLAELLEQAKDLHCQLEALGRSRGVTAVEQSADWYGFDPIHIKYRHWRTVWPAILASARKENAEVAPVQGSLRRWIYLRTRTAENWQLFGRARRRKQPCGALRDGSALSFF
jgi:hypothetical protein